MTPDEYVWSVLRRYAVPTGPTSPSERTFAALSPSLRQWAGQWLSNLCLSGSYAKGTAIKGVTDVDVFISLSSALPSNLREIYNSLYELATGNNWSPRRQNVSVGISYNAVQVDLVPGKLQSGYRNRHSLYVSKRDTWTQTDVTQHINTVSNSGRTSEIRAIKIWRNLRRLDFPSFYLELTVIAGLAYRPTTALADNVIAALRDISDNLTSRRVVDPANTNNVLSDDLSYAEKGLIVSAAQASLRARTWEEIIW